MKKAGMALIALLAVTIFLGGCNNPSKPTKHIPTITPQPTQTPTQTPAATTTPTITPASTSTTTPTPKDKNINITIEIPQSIKTGELFTGNYYITSDKKALDGARVFVCHSKEGISYSGYAQSNGFPCIRQTHPEPGQEYELSAFRIGKNSRESGLTDYFHEPGTYTYKVHVYDCSKINKELGVSDCGLGIEPRVVSKVKALATTSKSTIVTGQKIKDECNGKWDCTGPCEGCNEGPVCLLPDHKCVDCTQFVDCAEGYKCIAGKCVAETAPPQ